MPAKCNSDECTIIMFADDTALIVGVSTADESAHRQEVRAVQMKQLDVNKTLDIIMDPRKSWQ